MGLEQFMLQYSSTSSSSSNVDGSSSSTLISRARQKLGLILALCLAIWLIGDASFDVFSALKQHEPSYRIFRSLLEITVLFLGAAASLALWTRCMGTSTIHKLFFQPLLGHEGTVQPQQYAPADRNDNDDDEDEPPPNELLQRRHPGPDDVLPEHADAAVNDDEDDGEVPSRMDDNHDIVISALEVLHISLDLLLKILVTLFFFVLSSSRKNSNSNSDNGDDSNNNEPEENSDNSQSQDWLASFWNLFSQIAAPTFPLLLFLHLLYKAFFPWNRTRRCFWTVVSYTWAAPWFPVAFRDGFIGDVLTSSVRPLKDVSFTLFYILFGLQGWWSTQEYRNFFTSAVEQADLNVPAMERSWIVHTVVLPICTASPLWWRFLQNLRQVFDERQRWPYLGNALKYFLAAQVAMFGVFHPEQHHNPLWLASFVIATLYQIWWDIFMDWGLFNIKTGRLRSRRLYQSKAFYWTVAVANVVLRFFWTLSFLPLHYLNSTGALTENLAGNLVTHILGPVIASAEIIRRTMWGWLRFEWEVVRTMSDEFGLEDADGQGKIYLQDNAQEEEDYEKVGSTSIIELRPMAVQQSRASNMDELVLPPPHQRTSALFSIFKDMSQMNSIQVIGELSLYATIFCLFCLIVAAHRGTF